MIEVKIAKLQGLGNSYVVIEDFDRKLERRYGKLARFISDKGFGVGSDGLLVVNRGRLADYRMRIFNPDGSEAEFSGNGSRIFSMYLHDKKYIQKKATLEAGGKKGGKVITVNIGRDGDITVETVPAKLQGTKTISANGKRFTGFSVDLGNPHFVIFEKSQTKAENDAKLYGKSIEHNPVFPRGTNVEFVFVKNKKEIIAYTWERGAGLTSACGSGACASAFAAYKQNLVSNNIEVKLTGGNLNIRTAKDDSIIMRGPVEKILTGILSIQNGL